jgi:predicted Zn-dependent protease
MNLSLAVHPARKSFDLRRALQICRAEASDAEWIGLRFVSENTHQRAVRNEINESNAVTLSCGVMVEVLFQGHFAHAGTSDLSDEGVRRACRQALSLAKAVAPFKIHHFTVEQRPSAVGHYRSPAFQGLDDQSLGEFTDLLMLASQSLKISPQIVSALAMARIVETEIQFVSSNGSDVQQQFVLISTHFQATAQNGTESQNRSDKGSLARSLQTGFEVFDRDEIQARCQQAGKEALQLLKAPQCPTEEMDLLLAPDQMLIQIHESIGHPLELDRILGDERNYAGWSFVKPEDFGHLQYGSSLMNATFDPTVPGEFASYNFDDGGASASRVSLIENGKLVAGLGGLESQHRLRQQGHSIPGVANFRSALWNRAPIDRMANINLEPGASNLQQMIEQTERGIFMQTNISWSIDDYRNKFQFGCEFAQLIEEGRLTKVVKNPNYRGVTVPFWKSLKAVGNAEEMEIYGSPFCGKGEPGQVIRVGHASPPCLFEKVEVFGGGE